MATDLHSVMEMLWNRPVGTTLDPVRVWVENLIVVGAVEEVSASLGSIRFRRRRASTQPVSPLASGERPP